jgi:two-component system sensor histidine kinase KdpD
VRRTGRKDTRELLATLEESADRLTGLVDNLLDSSRLAAGAVRPVLGPVGYDEIVARALSGTDVDGDGFVEAMAARCGPRTRREAVSPWSSPCPPNTEPGPPPRQ